MNAEDIKLTPVILNENSSFVVITYWWGRGNLNRNLQTPCPYEIDEAVKNGVTIPIKKQGKNYDLMIDDWVANMKKLKLNYLEAEYPMFAVKGGYQNAINYKPNFIDAALRACYPRSVLYIDGDMTIKKYPRILDTPDIDFAARSWGIDIDDSENLCYEPFVFETSGGTLFFGQTPFGHKLLQMWKEEVKKHPGKAEDRVISLLFNNKKLMKDLNFIPLTIEYLWLSLLYDPVKSIKTHRSKPIITHPFCLTSEEAAIEMSDEMLKSMRSRIPKQYNYYVTNHVKCDRMHDTIYEYISYTDKKTAEQDSNYLNWINENGHTVISYTDKYGKYNTIADDNKQAMKKISISSNIIKSKTVSAKRSRSKNKTKTRSSSRNRSNNYKTVLVTTSSSIESKDYDVHVTKKDMIIPTILSCLADNKDVIYVPSSTKYLSLALRAIEKRREDGYQFIAKNANTSEKHFKKGYMLTIDRNYPVYFSHNNTVLFDLLMMSESPQKISKRFNSSSTFLSRIRCNWL